MEKSTAIFENFAIKQTDYKITALDYLDGYIYIGNASGALFKQRIKVLKKPKGRVSTEGDQIKLMI